MKEEKGMMRKSGGGGGEGGRGRGNDKRGWEWGWKWMGKVKMVEMGGEEEGISGNG